MGQIQMNTMCMVIKQLQTPIILTKTFHLMIPITRMNLIWTLFCPSLFLVDLVLELLPLLTPLTIVPNLIDGTAAAPTTIISNEAELNTLVNSNRVFINALAEITSLDC